MKQKPFDIKKAREKAGITQRELAAKSGFSLSAICKFEQKRRTPPMRSMPSILNALGL